MPWSEYLVVLPYALALVCRGIGFPRRAIVSVYRRHDEQIADVIDNALLTSEALLTLVLTGAFAITRAVLSGWRHTDLGLIAVSLTGYVAAFLLFGWFLVAVRPSTRRAVTLLGLSWQTVVNIAAVLVILSGMILDIASVLHTQTCTSIDQGINDVRANSSGSS